MANKFKLVLDGNAYDVERRDGLMVVNGMEFSLGAKDRQILISGTPHTVKLGPGTAEVDGIAYTAVAEGLEEPAQGKRAPKAAHAAASAGAITAIMPGLIMKLVKQEGDTVEAGDVVLILEAMKMQNEVKAKVGGVIRQMLVKQGDNVEMRQALCVIE